MFNRAAHESSLPCSSAPSQPPCAAAQQSCSRCSFIPSRKQLNYDRTPILAGSVSGRRTLGSRRLRLTCRSEAARPSVRHPVTKEAKAFAPATIANLGPGFDWMGCAVEVHITIPATGLHSARCVCIPIQIPPPLSADVFRSTNISLAIFDTTAGGRRHCHSNSTAR